MDWHDEKGGNLNWQRCNAAGRFENPFSFFGIKNTLILQPKLNIIHCY
jgi:hypothetical protein